MIDATRCQDSDLARRYEPPPYEAPELIRRLSMKMIESLRLREDDLLVDLQCGSGTFCLDILRQVKLRYQAVGVAPWPSLFARLPSLPALRLVRLDAVAFSEFPARWDKMLYKDAIHGVADKRALFQNLYRRLNDDGVLLLVQLAPQRDGPLFKEAVRRWEAGHWSPQELAVLLEEAGFHVYADGFEYRQHFSRADYLRLVEDRCLWVLDSFREEELEDGLGEIRDTCGRRRTIEFTDRFELICAIKPARLAPVPALH